MLDLVEMEALAIPVALFLALPLFLLFFFKTNAGMLFFGACVGLVMLTHLDTVAVAAAGALLPSEGESYVRLALVLTSMITAALLFRRTVHGSSLALHVGIVVLTGALLWLTLPDSTQLSWLRVGEEDVWRTLNAYKSVIIIIGFIASLLVTMPGASHRKKHRRSKH